MSDIDWENIKYFDPTKDKFSEDPDTYAEPKLIYALDLFRGITGLPIHPSPVSGALARLNGSQTSRHFVVGRKSDAIDIFCEGNIRTIWMLAITSGLFGGIGLYPFTNFKGRRFPMLHIDLRPFKRDGGKDDFTLLWLRDNEGEYYYPQRTKDDESLFYEILNDL